MSLPPLHLLSLPRSLIYHSTNLSTKALESAAEAAGYSKEYAKVAAKYIITEVARDVGWAMNTNTATAAMESVITRFPLLADIKRAYDEGAVGIPARVPGQQLLLTDRIRTHAPVEDVSHPRDVREASNLDDIAMIGAAEIGNEVVLRRSAEVISRGRQRKRRGSQ